MAYTRIKYGIANGPYNYSVFILDDESDMANLPTNSAPGILDGRKVGICSPGSKAVIVSTNEEYMMNNSGEWTYMGQHTGSGSSSGYCFSVDDDGDGNVTIS